MDILAERLGVSFDKNDWGSVLTKSPSAAGIHGLLQKWRRPRPEDRGQRADNRRQRSDDRGQRADNRRQRSDDRRQRAEDRGQKTNIEHPPAMHLASGWCLTLIYTSNG
jgi:hypothetical protein